MISKTEQHQYFFEVQLNWQHGRIGILTANDVRDIIKVATPPEFSGGVPDMWSPEHLFLSSLSSCFMTTYLSVAEKNKLTIAHFECSVIGQVELIEGHLEFTVINLFPKIYIEKQQDISLANDVLMQSYKHSIIANSIKPHLIHHGEVIVEEHTRINKKY